MSEYSAELNVRVNSPSAQLDQLVSDVDAAWAKLESRVNTGLGGGNPFGDTFDKSLGILKNFQDSVGQAMSRIKGAIDAGGGIGEPLAKSITSAADTAKRSLQEMAAEAAKSAQTPAQATALITYYQDLAKSIQGALTMQRDFAAAEVGKAGTGNLLGANSKINSIASPAGLKSIETTALDNLPKSVRESMVAVEKLTADLRSLTEASQSASGGLKGEQSKELKAIRDQLLSAAQDPSNPLHSSVSVTGNNRVSFNGADGTVYGVGAGKVTENSTAAARLQDALTKEAAAEEARAAAAQQAAAATAEAAAQTAARAGAQEAADSELESAKQKQAQAATAGAAATEKQTASTTTGTATTEAANQRTIEAQRKMTASMENAARRSTAWGERLDGSGLQVRGTPFSYSPSSSGFVNVNTGAMASFNEAISLTDRLAQQMHELAAAERSASEGLGTSFINGFFGAGGRKYSGGARPISELNPLAGFGETAGIVAKYSLQGQAIQGIAGFLTDSVKGYADLDRAVREYNTVTGDAGGTNGTFLSSLEQISVSAGIDVVQALDAATRGVAAFADAGASVGSKQEVAQNFVQAVTTNAAITNQTPDASATDIIATGKSFGIAADGLESINNAIANARQSFGADGAAVSQTLQLFADTGRQAGYSLTELAQVIGLVQAKTGESGTALAGNLQRIFAQFSSSAGKQALEVAGVDPSGNIKQQIEGLAAAYPRLTEAERQNVFAHLGGAKALRDLLPLLEDNTALQKSFSDALNNGDAGTRQYRAEIDSLAGQLRQFGALVKQIAINVANSGVLTPLVAAFESIKPILQVLNNILGLWASMPGPIKAATGAILAYVAASRLMAAARIAGAEGDTSGLAGFVGRFTQNARSRDTSLSGIGVTSVAELDAAMGAYSKAIADGGQLVAAAEARVAAAQDKGAEEIAAANEQLANAQRVAATLMEQANVKVAAAIGGGATAAAAAAAGGGGSAAADVEVAAAATEAGAALRLAAAEAAFAAGGFATLGEALAATGASSAEVLAVAGADLAAELDATARLEAVAGAELAASTERVALEVYTGATLIGASFKELVADIFIGRENAKLALSETSGVISAGAAKIGVSLDGLSAAIAAGAGKVAAVGSVAAGEQVAAAVAGGLGSKLSTLGASALSGARGLYSIGNGTGASASLLGGSALTGAAVVGYGTFEAIKSQRALSNAQDNAVGALSDSYSANDASSLKAAAESLNAASEKVKSSTGGLFGSLGGEIADLRGNLGGALTGGLYESGFNKAQRLQTTATEDNREATHLQELQKQLSSSGNLDFTAVDGVTSGLKDMAAGGADARDQLEALTKSLTDFGNAAQNPRTLTAADVTLAPAKLADQIRSDALLQNENTSVSHGALNHIDQAALTTGLESDLTSGFDALGLKAGQGISSDQVKQLQQLAQDSLKQRLKDAGAPFETLPKELQDRLLAAAKGDVSQFVNNLGATGGEYTKDNIDAAIAAAPQLANTAATETSNDASLKGYSLDGSASSGIAGAQARLQSLQKVRDAAVKLGKSDTDLHQLDDEITSAQLQLQQATTSHIDAMGQLAEAQASPFNKGQQIQAQLDTVNQKIAATTDADQLTILFAQQEKLQQAKAQADLEDANLLEASNVAVGDTLGDARAALDAANAKLDQVLADPNSSPGAVAQAQKDAANKQLALAQQTTDAANSLIVSTIDPRDKTALADQAATDAAQKVADLKAAGEDKANGGVGTTAYNNAVTAAAQAAQAAKDAHREADNAGTADLDPRSTVKAAEAQVKIAKRNLDAALAGQGDYATADKAYKDALRNLAQARVSKSNADDELIDPRQTVKYAQGQLDIATRNLGLEKKGTQGYKEALKAQQAAELSLAQAKDDKANAEDAAKTDPRDTVKNAENGLKAAERSLREQIPGTKGYYEAQRKVAEAKQAVSDAERGLSEAIRDSKVFVGSAVDAASASLADATAELNADKKNTQKYYEDLAKVKQAQKALADAIIAAQHNARLLNIDMTDPVAMAQEEARQAAEQLAKDKAAKAPKDVLDADKVASEQADANSEKAAFEQRLGDARTNYQLGRTTQAAYLQYLESEHERLSAIKNKTRQQQDELNEVDQEIKGITDSSQGQFNLGDIKLPTVYEVRRVFAARGAEIGQGLSDAVDQFGTGVDNGPIGSLNKVINGIQTNGAVTNINNLIQAIKDLAGAKPGSTATDTAGGSTGTGSKAQTANDVKIEKLMEQLATDQTKLKDEKKGSKDYNATSKEIDDLKKQIAALQAADAKATQLDNLNSQFDAAKKALDGTAVGSPEYFAAQKAVYDAQLALIKAGGDLDQSKGTNNQVSGGLVFKPLVDQISQLKLPGAGATNTNHNSSVIQTTHIEINGADFARVMTVLNERLGNAAMQSGTTSTRKVYA